MVQHASTFADGMEKQNYGIAQGQKGVENMTSWDLAMVLRLTNGAA
jgi:hypothetical protein